MKPGRALGWVAAYLGLGVLGMACWWWAARPPAPGTAPASPIAAALLGAGEPRLDYPREVPADLVGEARANWRSAHLDGWKWRLAQCLDGQPGAAPPNLFPPDDQARADGFRAGWGAAHTQVNDLVGDLGVPGTVEFVHSKGRQQPGLHNPSRSVPPPPE